jgi:hypothetical protein
MSTQPVQNYFAARDDNKTDLPLIGRMTQQPQIISRGFLNPTTDRQTSFARRLVEGKKMSDADRNKYRGILNMNGLTVGEVGAIIDAVKDNEDRTASEIAESVARDHQVPDGEVVNTPSALASPSKPSGGTKRIIDLVIGDKINAGRVAFVHDKGNGLVDLGVVLNNGKLSVLRSLDGNVRVDMRPDGTNTNNQMVGGNNAVNNFAGVANQTLDDIKRAYPGHEVLPNGDLVVGKREFTDAAGRRTRYEAVVHRTANETFIGYVRQVTLAPNGNVVRTRAAAFTAPAHSSVAALNRIGTLFTGDGGPGSGMNGAQPNNWFNNLDSVSENIDPRTGQLLPVNLIPGQDFNPIGNTGIQKTGDGLKDALIAHVANLIDRGLLSDQILEQVAGVGDRNFNILSRHQFMDIIERIEARRANPGLNAIPYVSRDEKTIVRVGDVVHHYDANGNRLTLPGGAEKIGKVVRRETLQVYEKAQGRYEYRDILWVKFEGRAQVTPIAARRLAVIKRADGSDPVPAVNEPNAPAAPAPNAGLPPAIPRPGARPRPAGPNVPAGADVNPAIRFTGADGKTYNIDRGMNMTRFSTDSGELNDIFVMQRPDNKWHVLRGGRDGVPIETIASYNGRIFAENVARLKIVEGVQSPRLPSTDPVEPVTPADLRLPPATPPASNPNNPDNLPVRVLGGRNVIQRQNTDGTVEFVNIDNGQTLAKVRMDVVDSPGGGVDIWFSETQDGRQITNGGNKSRVLEATSAILDGIGRPTYEVPRVIAGADGKDYNVVYFLDGTIYEPNRGDRSEISVTLRPDGKWHATTGGRDGRPLETIQSFEFRRDAERYAEKLIMEGGQAPAAPARLMPTEIEIEGRGFRGVPSFNGNALTFYDDSGNEAATITRQPDGTFQISEPFGGLISVAESMDDAKIIAGNKIRENIQFGFMDSSEAESSGPGTNLPPTPAPSVPATPEAPATPTPATPEATAEPRRLNIQQVIRMKEIAQRELARLEEQYPDGRGEPEIMDIDPPDGQMKPIRRSEVLRRKINQYIQRQAEAAQNIREGRDVDAPRNDQSGNVVPSQAPTSFPSPESSDAESPTSVPSTPSEDTSLNALNVTLRGVKMTAQRDDTGFTTFDENGGEGAYAVANDDGTFSVYDPSTGENEVVDNEAEAVILAGAINFNNIRGGFHQPKYSPKPSEPSQPALPSGYTSSPVGSGNNAYEVKHDTDKENTPYYLVEQDGGGFFMSKWDSQNSAEAQRFRRPAQRMTFGSKEQADQWIADDLSSDGGDGGNGGGGNPPSTPTTPPAGGNFATDRIPAGMSLQEMNTFNLVGPSDLMLFPDGYPNIQQNRGKLYGLYVKNPNNNYKYDAFVSGPGAQQERDEFDTPEQAHDWVVEQLRNRAPTPAPPFNPVIPQGVIGKAAVRQWITDNYGADFFGDDVNTAIYGNYEEVTPHLVDSLNMKRAFEGGFTELGTLPRWGDPGFRQGGSLPDAGVNPTRKIRLSDGTFAYLKHTAMGTDEAFHEVMAARLFEAVGVNDLVAVSVKDPRRPNEYSVLTREIQGEMGEAFTGDVNNLTNAREISLIDYLINNDDRHENNWMFNGDVAYPIDHGYAFNPNDTRRPFPLDFREIEVDGNFSEPIERWVNSTDPKTNPLFTQEELTSIYTKINELRDNFVTHSIEQRKYFDDYIMPRFDVLMGIWR